MRTLLLAALSLSALTPSREADACGGYNPEPQVLRVTTHVVVTNGKVIRRAFAHSGAANPTKKLDWKKLAPTSFDPTQIAAGTMLANPVTFTLVGPSGTRVVKVNKQVFLSKSWSFDTVTSAVEVPASDPGFSIAIEGDFASAAWIELDDVYTSQNPLVAWVKAQGEAPFNPNSIILNRVKGTNVETVSFYPKGGTKLITYLRAGDRNLGRFTGSPMGAFSNGLEIKLVVTDDETTSTVYVGMLGLSS